MTDQVAAGVADVPGAASLASTNRKVALRIMPLLVLAYIVAFIDRADIGFAKLGFMKDLGFNETIYGFGAGIFYLGYILLEVPSNVYLAKVGARATFLRIMILWGIACAALAFMTEATHFYGLRFLLGAAEAGFFPGVLLYLTYWVPPATRGRTTAVFMASIPIAGMLGGPLAGYIMSGMADVGGLKGWQWLFILEGLPAVILGVVCYLYLDDKPQTCTWLSEGEKAVLLRELEKGQAKPAHAKAGILAALNVQVVALAATAFSLMVSTAALFLWLPTVLRRAGVENARDIGLLSIIPFLIGFVAQYLNGLHSDKTGERRKHAFVAAFIAAIGWALLPLFQDSPALSIVFLTVTCAGTFAAMGPFWSLPQTLLSPAMAPAGIAFVTTLAGFGNFISPILVGWLADETGSLAAGQYYYAAVLLIGSSAVLWQPGKKA